MKNNKTLLLLALSAIVIGGCSKSEVDVGSINSSNAISFSTSTDKQTKASVLGNTNVTYYDFGVFAYYTESTAFSSYSQGMTTPNFMNDQTVEYSSGWTYSPIKYWPNTSGEMISFFGYMPKNEYNSTGVTANMATTKVNITSGSLPSITFRQDMDVENMTDFTVGQVLDQVKTSEAVSIPFNHVLTRLNFSAKLESGVDSETSVSITGLKLLGSSTRLISAATYKLAYDGTNGSWGTTNGGGTAYTSDIDVADILNLTDSKFVVSTTTATSFLTSNQYLFLIPPYGKSGIQSDSDVCIEIVYDVVTTDASITENNGSASFTTTKELSLPIGSLVEGIAYNIVITIGLDEVKLEADQTGGWDTDIDANAVPTSIIADNATDVESGISGAFADDVTEYTVDYVGDTENLTIEVEIPTDCDNYDMDIVINLPDQTEAVTITVPANYTGSITIYAPDATVTADATTADGATYTDVTVTTAQSTFIIPAGVKVNGLTILGGNVEVYGELSGEVVKGESNTESTTIEFKYGSTNSTTSIDTGITVIDNITSNGFTMGTQDDMNVDATNGTININ